MKGEHTKPDVQCSQFDPYHGLRYEKDINAICIKWCIGPKMNQVPKLRNFHMIMQDHM